MAPNISFAADSDGDGVDDAVDVDDDNDNLIELATLDDLNEVRNNLDGTALFGSSAGCLSTCNGFELINDLDFDTNGDNFIDANDDYWNGGEGWLPIDGGAGFKSIFEGNGYTIKNLNINRPGTHNVGLFGDTDTGAEIVNLGLKQVKVIGDLSTGGLVGNLDYSIVNNVYVEGSVHGGDESGGVFGYTEFSQISEVYHVGTMTGLADIGGVIGYSEYDTISRIFNIGPVTGDGITAGAIGDIDTSVVSDIFSTGTINGTSEVGGIIGYMNGADVDRVFTTATVNGNTRTGAIIGHANGSSDGFTSSYFLANNGLNGIGDSEIVDISVVLTEAEFTCPQSAGDAGCTPVVYADWDDATPIWDFGNNTEYPGLVIGGVTHRIGDYDSDGVADEIDGFPSVSIIGYLDPDGDGIPSTCNAVCLASGMVADVDDDNDNLIEISSLDDLDEIRNNLNGNALFGSGAGCLSTCNGFELISDLDFDTNGDNIIDANDEYWNAGEGWLPIGTSADQFVSIFEGNNHLIKRLTINRPLTENNGVFGKVNAGAELKNLGVVNANIIGARHTAGLVGYLTDSMVRNVYVLGSIQGLLDNTGGVIGYSVRGQISEVFHVGNVSGEGAAGGVIAQAADSEVSRVFNIGSVIGNSAVGGVIGESYSNLSEAFSTGMVSGNDSSAGIVGYMSNANLHRVFTTANITGISRVGATIGWAAQVGDGFSSSYFLANNGLNGIGDAAIADSSAVLTESEFTCPQLAADADCTPVVYNGWDDATPIWDFGNNTEYPGLVIGGITYRIGDFDNDGVADEIDGFPSVSIDGYLDPDGDGIPAECDAICLANGMAADEDNDNDGLTNDVDTDDDNDGVLDVDDDLPFDPTESEDLDGDGIGDNSDTDIDGDGMPNNYEDTYGFDPLVDDSVLDLDQDNIPNYDEYFANTQPNNANDYQTKLVESWQDKGEASFDLLGEDERHGELNLIKKQLNKVLIAGYNTKDGEKRISDIIRVSDKGELDLNFANNGHLQFGDGTDAVNILSMELLANNGFLVLLEYASGSFEIQKFNMDGGIDVSFALQGILTIDNADTGIYGLSLLTNQQFVVFGFHTSVNAKLWMFNNDGSPDANFDGDGELLLQSPGGGNSHRVSAVSQQNGQLLVALRSFISPTLRTDSYIVRMDYSGIIDATFNNNAGNIHFYHSQEITELVSRIEVLADQSFWVLSENNSNMLQRYLSNGETDSAFSDNGVLKLDLTLALRSVVFNAEKFNVVKSNGNYFEISLYDNSGELDLDYAVNGIFRFVPSYEFEVESADLIGTRLWLAGKAALGALHDDGYGEGPEATRIGWVLNILPDNDSDDDGINDNIDNDDDNDGVNDNADDFPFDASESVDTDGDGIGNNADTDDDNDGTSDVSDAFPLDSSESKDSDGDGIGNNADTDDDNDGYSDLDEIANGTSRVNADDIPQDNDGDFVSDLNDSDDDNDGVLDVDDDLPFDETESVDTDGDGIGNNADPDDDGDGVADEDDMSPLNPEVGADDQGPVFNEINSITFEATGATTNITIDAPEVADNFDETPTVVSNLTSALPLGEHVIVWTATDDAGNQSTAEQIVIIEDTTAPIFDTLEAIELNAAGRLTNISTAVNVSANDLVDGEITAIISGSAQLLSGAHQVEMIATDLSGNSEIALLDVNVLPELTVANSLVVEASGQYQINVNLSGNAPDYPVEIEYELILNGDVIDNPTALIRSGSQGLLTVTVPTDVMATDSLMVNVSSISNAFIGRDVQTQLNIVEANLAPNLNLSMTQVGAAMSIVDPAKGVVTIQAQLSDVNQSDTHDFIWTVEDNVFSDADNDSDAATFEFNPADLIEGHYNVTVQAIENNTDELLEVSRTLRIIVENLADLDGNIDSDNDGVSDEEEGYDDEDNDGIANYLDDDNNPTRLPTGENTERMQTSPGLSLSLGRFSQSSSSKSAGLTMVQLAEMAGPNAADTNDTFFIAISPTYNFVIDGLVQQGDSASVVLPLASGNFLPEGAVYRKYNTEQGWYHFVEDSNNSVSSALTDDNGICPMPNDEAYVLGLTLGDNCIQLTIEDGGDNDIDFTANSSIEDPGVITVYRQNTAPVIETELNIAADEATKVTLDASESYDHEEDELTFSWLQTGGQAVDLNDNTEETITFITPSVSSDETLTFELTVSDGLDDSVEVVELLVKQINLAPSVSIDSHDETYEQGDMVTLNVQSSDPDNDVLTYLWEQISGPQIIFDDETSAEVSFTLPDVSSDQTIEVKVTVSDGELSSSSTTTITVQKVAEVVVDDSDNSSGGGSFNLWLLMLGMALVVTRSGYRVKFG